ncbi:UNVERIFIED_CONTAM: hypothetical protein O8I53_08090 [Campylobacter lari]
MKLFLDTTNDDFVLATFDEQNELVYQKILKKYPKKVELIPLCINEMLKNTNTKITDYTCFYTNLGPGYFTGVRISLVYLRTISQILNQKIKTISSMQILKLLNPQIQSFNINARGEKFYHYEPNDEFHIDQVTLKTGVLENYSIIDYDMFLTNFKTYEKEFKA